MTVAVKYNKQQLDYGKVGVIAFNGTFPNGNTHPKPNSSFALIGRSPKIHDCGDWSYIEFPVWSANKNFDNIAIMAYTNEDNISSTVLVNNLTVCETLESECKEVEVDAAGNPVLPTDLGVIPSTFSCTTYDDEDDYFNGNLTDLYDYNGTFNMYNQYFSETSEQCFNIGGDEIPDETPIDCDAELIEEGILETCQEVQNLANSVQKITQESHDYPLIQPLTGANCDGNNTNPLKEQMAYCGRDIIFVHGLMISNLVDRANGVKGAMTLWSDKKEFEKGGYYKDKADANWQFHIQNYLISKGYKNRYLIVTYNSSQDAETAANSVASQIRDAMETGKGVKMSIQDTRFTLGDKNERIAKCFGKEYVIISHSTGGLVTNIMLSTANKTKTIGSPEQGKYGNIGFISDRCKGHIAMHSAISGSNIAAVAVALTPQIAGALQIGANPIS